MFYMRTCVYFSMRQDRGRMGSRMSTEHGTRSHTAAVRLFSDALIAAAARGRSRDVRSGLSTTGPRGFRIGYGAYPFVASRHASRAAGAWHNAATAPPCSTAASSAPVRYRPDGDGRSLELVRGTVGFRGVCVVRQRQPARRCSLGWRQGLSWCVKLRVPTSVYPMSRRCVMQSASSVRTLSTSTL